MQLLSLNIRHRRKVRPVRVVSPRPYSKPTTDLSRARWPIRGLLFSLLFHSTAFSGVVYLSSHGFLARAITEDRAETIEFSPDQVLYLPALSSNAGSVRTPRRNSPAETKTKGTEGLSYPGPQRIISDVPRPTNNFQTLLQPELINPPTLRSPILLPNMAQMTNAGPRLQAPTPPPMKAPARIAAIAEPQQVQPARFGSVSVRNPVALPDDLRATAPPMVLPATVTRLERPDPTVAPAVVAMATPKGPLAAPELRATAPPMATPAGVRSIEQPASPVTTSVLPSVAPIKTSPVAELRATPPPVAAPGRVQSVEQPGTAVAPPRFAASLPVNTAPSLGLRATAPPQARPATVKEVEAPGTIASTAQTTQRVAPIQGPSATQQAAPTAPPAVVPRTMASALPAAEVVSAAPKRAPVPTTGLDSRNLLSVSPLPPPPEERVRVPVGEARGRVAISPDGNLNASSNDLGVKSSNPPAPAPALGKGTDGTANAPKNDAPAPRGTPAIDAPASASGRGNIPATAGIASPGSPFPGITILGGHLEPADPRGGATTPGVVTLTRPGVPPPPAASIPYNMTIVATAGSGGGLPDFGVFANERVYTVYVDVKPRPEAASRSWILQYAVSEAAGAANDPNQTGVTPPFPIVKEHPLFAADLLRNNSGRLVVVFAVLGTDGKLQQLSVKQTPEPSLGPVALAALGKWTFRPAELNGRPVAARVLIGIPLAP